MRINSALIFLYSLTLLFFVRFWSGNIKQQSNKPFSTSLALLQDPLELCSFSGDGAALIGDKGIRDQGSHTYQPSSQLRLLFNTYYRMRRRIVDRPSAFSEVRVQQTLMQDSSFILGFRLRLSSRLWIRLVDHVLFVILLGMFYGSG